MKRISPRREYDADSGYPSVVDVDLHRRGFLGTALRVGAGVLGVGAGLLLPDPAEAGRKHGRRRVVLYVRYQPSGCKYRVEKVVVRSYEKRLIAFLGKVKERAGVSAAVRKVLSKYSCKDLVDLKQLSKLHKALGKTLAARYQKRTRRRASAPLVSVVVGQQKQRPDVDGDVAMPSVPLLPIA